MTINEAGAVMERRLFEALEALKDGDVEPWVAMFDDDGVIEFPFAPPGNPKRLNDKTQIADYMKAYPEHVRIATVQRGAVYHSGSVIIAEFTCEGTAVPTGNAFTMSYVGIITHSGGLVKLYRDYWNPLIAMRAMGQHSLTETTVEGAAS